MLEWRQCRDRVFIAIRGMGRGRCGLRSARNWRRWMRRRRSWGSCEGGGRFPAALVGPFASLTTWSGTLLLCDHPAGYAVTGIAGGIRLHVVGFGVDDDCGAAVAEE